MKPPDTFPTLETDRLLLREVVGSDVPEIFAIHGDNEPSIKLLRRLRFVEEGRLRQGGYWAGQHHDLLQYSLLREDWIA
jgi:RimJ/RimL family protein N-acetyltransferase